MVVDTSMRKDQAEATQFIIGSILPSTARQIHHRQKNQQIYAVMRTLGQRRSINLEIAIDCWEKCPNVNLPSIGHETTYQHMLWSSY